MFAVERPVRIISKYVSAEERAGMGKPNARLFVTTLRKILLFDFRISAKYGANVRFSIGF